MEYLQGLFPGRADTLFEACRLEEVSFVFILLLAKRCLLRNTLFPFNNFLFQVIFLCSVLQAHT